LFIFLENLCADRSGFWERFVNTIAIDASFAQNELKKMIAGFVRYQPLASVAL
jgi:hypothetical protein